MQVLKLQTGVEGREGEAFTINKGVLVNATHSPSLSPNWESERFYLDYIQGVVQ